MSEHRSEAAEHSSINASYLRQPWLGAAMSEHRSEAAERSSINASYLRQPWLERP